MTGAEARKAVDPRIIEWARARLSIFEMLEDGRIGFWEWMRLRLKLGRVPKSRPIFINIH